MDFESYQLLKTFGNTLEDTGINNLSAMPIEDELRPYYELYSKFKERFSAYIINDLSKLLSASITVVRNNFYLEDPDMQGASHIDFKLSLSENNYSFELKVACLVFMDRIMLSFDTPEIMKFKLSKQTLQILNSFIKINDYHYLAELRNLR